MPEIGERSVRETGAHLARHSVLHQRDDGTGPPAGRLRALQHHGTRHTTLGGRRQGQHSAHGGGDAGLTWLAELVGGEAIRSAPAASVSITTETACGDTAWADGGEASAPHVTSAVTEGRGAVSGWTTLTH